VEADISQYDYKREAFAGWISFLRVSTFPRKSPKTPKIPAAVNRVKYSHAKVPGKTAEVLPP
jgi:hypothetical protein